jgi:hypothetical protein
MPTVSTEFTAPCTQDRAILAVQDLANSLQWPILEVGASRVVVKAPKSYHFGQSALSPKAVIQLKEVNDETVISVSVSLFNGNKQQLTGIMGQWVNGISLRVQTKSIAINPTVALGEGQGEAQSDAPATDRLAQLERLQKLLESGILTREEFDAEKQRVIRQA